MRFKVGARIRKREGRWSAGKPGALATVRAVENGAMYKHLSLHTDEDDPKMIIEYDKDAPLNDYETQRVWLSGYDTWVLAETGLFGEDLKDELPI